MIWINASRTLRSKRVLYGKINGVKGCSCLWKLARWSPAEMWRTVQKMIQKNVTLTKKKPNRLTWNKRVVPGGETDRRLRSPALTPPSYQNISRSLMVWYRKNLKYHFCHSLFLFFCVNILFKKIAYTFFFRGHVKIPTKHFKTTDFNGKI